MGVGLNTAPPCLNASHNSGACLVVIYGQPTHTTQAEMSSEFAICLNRSLLPVFMLGTRLGFQVHGPLVAAKGLGWVTCLRAPNDYDML